MRYVFVAVLLAGMTGCGPIFVPMLPRLNAEDQRHVDQMWDNMLTPVQRVDRQTLLDASIANWMFAIGVDRMHMKCEKYFSGGTVIMEVDCDRANPDVDQFTITVLDEHGRTVRRERYSRAEVEDSSRMLRGIPNLGPTDLRSIHVQAQVTVNIGEPTTHPSTQVTTQAVPESSTTRLETPDERQFRLESERRQTAAKAATQPARLVPSMPTSSDP